MSRAPLRAVALLGCTAIVTPMLVGLPLAQAADVDVTIDGGQTFQTIEALGADINPRSWDDGNLKPALDLLIDDAGMKTFRVGMDMMAWESRNDDSDPQTFNWDYYEPIYSGRVDYDTDLVASSFADTWDVIDYLHEKGVPDSQIALSFMGPGPEWMGGSSLARGMEDEFVEGVLSAAYYGYSHGHTFGLFSPNNEMDITWNEGVTMSADRYADVLDRLAGRMDELGMGRVGLLGPETCCDVSYAEPMKDHPRLMSHLAAFDFHNYGGGDSGAADAVAGTGKSFWISEYGNFDHTFAYLDQGAAGLLMWEAYDSVYNHAVLNGHGTAPGNDSLSFGITPLLAYDEDTRTYAPRDEFYYFAQLMKWVPVGAERIGADSADDDVQIEAFRDPATDRLTLVGQNTSESELTLSIALKDLVAPTSLDYFQTNSKSHMEQGPDVAVTGDAATVTVPARTTFTLTGTSDGTDIPDPPTPTDPPTPDPTTPPTPDPTTPPTPDPTTPPTPDPTTPPELEAQQLFGLDTVEDYADNDAAGEAEAFQFEATTDGLAGSVALYVDSGSLATTVEVGVYSDDDGQPGTLLASGSLDGPSPESWNTVPLDVSPVVTAGASYWIAILGTDGRINYRDQPSGRCSQSHVDTDLTGLPLTWESGRAWPTCGLSAHVMSVEGGAPIAGSSTAG